MHALFCSTNTFRHILNEKMVRARFIFLCQDDEEALVPHKVPLVLVTYTCDQNANKYQGNKDTTWGPREMLLFSFGYSVFSNMILMLFCHHNCLYHQENEIS